MISLLCDDPILSIEDDNLCLLAARILQSRFDISAGAEIDLKKNIPMGAGLGGGSSDAATTLILLNELWDLGCSGPEFRELGAMLGSDIPVFMHDTPALGTGRGEILSTLGDGPDHQMEPHIEIPFSFAVLKLDVHVSTAEAYGSIVPDERERADLGAVVRSLDLDRWKAELVNDFEAPVADRYPSISKALMLLRNSGAGYAAMTGSGSAVFGVFERESEAAAAAHEGAQQGLRTWSGGLYQPMRPF